MHVYGIRDAIELTADDVKTLRAAQSVSFHKLAGDSFVELVLRRSVGRGQFHSVAEVVLRAASRVTDYTRRYDDPTPRPQEHDYACHASHISDGVWTTATSALKTGDVLLVEWIRGNDSPAMTEAGATADELRLTVIRPGKRPNLTYILSYSVHAGMGAELSRMVRAPRRQYALVDGS